MNNKVYIYQDTFIELLSLIKFLLKNNLVPINIKTEDYNPNLFEEKIFLDILVEEDIIKEILTEFGNTSLSIMYHVYLSDDENKELVLYYYFLNAIKYRKKINLMRNKRCVSEALRIAKYVSHENHKLKGFVRFKELTNKMLYAEIEPTNNVLSLLSNHFKHRLKEECWIIKDNKRNLYSIYDKKDFNIYTEQQFRMADYCFSSEELDIQRLWKEFYKTIGIAKRKNDRCRMNFMPKKYWKYIIEVSEEL